MTVIRRRRKWLYRTALAAFAVGGVLGFVGFDAFFMPLVMTGSVCMWRASYWDGWLDGSKITAQSSPTSTTQETS